MLKAVAAFARKNGINTWQFFPGMRNLNCHKQLGIFLQQAAAALWQEAIVSHQFWPVRKFASKVQDGAGNHQI